MSKTIKLCKGLDIKLQGAAEKKTTEVGLASTYAVTPLDFEGIVPKMLVKVGDAVKAGTPLFFNKNNASVVFTSPVSGTVAAVVRGEKRRILAVEITADKTIAYEEFETLDVAKATRDQIVELLLKSGLWTLLIQRPYGIIANPADMPKSIFVSAFDSAPLAPDYGYTLAADKQALQKGFEVLARLTTGKVHLSYNAQAEAPAFTGVELHAFQGKHPAGNVGVQIHHIDPINKGEKVWTVGYSDVAIIGRLFLTGKVDMTRTIAVTGAEVKSPAYVKVVAGAKLDSILKGQVAVDANVRYISGNVLTGRNVGAEGYLGYYANQITVIPEGDHYELLGWAMPRFSKFSVSRAYLSWLFPNRKYNLDTNLNGEERAFVVTGLYEKYLPMDIYPMHLLKAILAGDLDKMEALGIYEVVEEDFALCEFVDPSKTEMQQIIRNGINLMIKEGE
ncbi:MAG: Na(+)-translocating NADH-quinone reductase subunit A [Rikenellaceae bacterium]|nr:Na(+)-translocating NADH-quinone reductase subunit A [Rikenellaceae bacterium]